MYFHHHSNNENFNGKLKSIQCEAVKSNGQQCKNHTVIGQKFCHSHRQNTLHLQIKDSNIQGANKGLFAIGKGIVFRTGARICMYNGQLIDVQELIRRYGYNTAPYAIQLHNEDGEQQFEDASIERGIGSLANHSCVKSKINARLSISRGNRAQLIATKNIRGGQEILVDYGDDYKFDEDVCSSTNHRKLTC